MFRCNIFISCLLFLILTTFQTSMQVNKDIVLPWKFTEEQPRAKRDTIVSNISVRKLIDECAELRALCSELSSLEDLPLLECIQTFNYKQINDLNEKCQHAIWLHTKELLVDDNLKPLLRDHCPQETAIMQCEQDSKSQMLFSCIIDHRNDVKSNECHNLLGRLQWVAFSDFRLITPFIQACENDIKVHKCGRYEPKKEVLSQGKTLACLQDKIDTLSNVCQQQILHLSEIQADNIKLDRQLYLACAADQIRFCPNLRPGDGLVFKCLTQNKLDTKMSPGCKEHLSRRQKLIARDYRVSRGLARACKEDIKTNHCRKGVSDDKDIRLAQILLCLEGVIRNGTKVNADCQAEMIDHRKILLEDFHLSPEIVDGCAEDISTFCSGMEVGGRTIHCLMEHARPKRKKRVSDTCLRALEILVKQTDAGEDWRVDPVLREACKGVVDRSCSGLRSGDARVMSCLLDKLGTEHMTEQCENALVQIQYFIARDFKMDPQLYRACRDDAVRFCHAKRSWNDFGEKYEPDSAPLVLPCLYRYAYHSKPSMQLRPICLEEIRRVMRQRAVSVDLHPEIEETCLEDLAMFCFDRTARGEEMQCLQSNLDNLKENCKTAVSGLIEDQAAHVELNPVIRTVCHRMMERFCDAELRIGKDEGDIMECLIVHKNEPEMRTEGKCRAAVEHFQLISLKNYHFTYKFKEACKSYVVNFCQAAKTKADVIECLSERVRNDTIQGVRNNIPKECRQQLRAQLLQQRENIIFDPKLNKLCLKDIDKHCKEVEHGSAKILECLQNKPELLTPECHRAVFKVKKEDMMDNSIDYILVTVCQDMIKLFCGNTDKSNILDCLKIHKDESYFNKKCKLVVLQRMIEQNKDYRFNPALQSACQDDINKFCKKILVEAQEEELNGKVIKCLKVKFREARLTMSCEKQMAQILREQALNYNLNPLLRTVCENELEILCKTTNDNIDNNNGEAEECLKEAFLKKKHMSTLCKMEVASMIEEAKADIHVDPLLQRACSVDLLKYCQDVLQGAGRHIKCLQTSMENSKTPLQDECRMMLIKRMEMFQNAIKVLPLEGLQDIYSQVIDSPSRRYIFIISLTLVGFIFISGLFCGRVTKRTYAGKNK